MAFAILIKVGTKIHNLKRVIGRKISRKIKHVFTCSQLSTRFLCNLLLMQRSSHPTIPQLVHYCQEEGACSDLSTVVVVVFRGMSTKRICNKKACSTIKYFRYHKLNGRVVSLHLVA